jgi:hypothetical protein
VRAVLVALRAAHVTFAIYALEALLALFVSAPLTSELTRDARALGARPLFRAAALEHGLELLPALRVEARSLTLAALLMLALTPLLRMAWLSALASPLGVRRALGEGARLYLRALSASLLLLACTVLALAPWLLFAYLVDAWLDARARLHDLLLFAAAGSVLPVLFLASVAHDLAHAFALAHGPLRAARLTLRAALSPRAFPAALLALIAGALVGALPLLLLANASPAGALFAVALTQAGAFCAAGVRSVWLAHALACTERYAASRDARD